MKVIQLLARSLKEEQCQFSADEETQCWVITSETCLSEAVNRNICQFDIEIASGTLCSCFIGQSPFLSPVPFEQPNIPARNDQSIFWTERIWSDHRNAVLKLVKVSSINARNGRHQFQSDWSGEQELVTCSETVATQSWQHNFGDEYRQEVDGMVGPFRSFRGIDQTAPRRK